MSTVIFRQSHSLKGLFPWQFFPKKGGSNQGNPSVYPSYTQKLTTIHQEAPPTIFQAGSLSLPADQVSH
ncbi:MAG: hypothetical protein IIZ39_03925, partial [Blautia sp.]|nr:hypothetical protein [Blautia sp.]